MNRLCFWIKRPAQVHAQVGAKDIRAEIDLFAEDWLCLIEIASHVDILRSLAGKKKCRRTLLRGCNSRQDLLGIHSFQNINRFVYIATKEHQAMRERLSPCLQRIGYI